MHLSDRSRGDGRRNLAEFSGAVAKRFLQQSGHQCRIERLHRVLQHR
jgi:hypothetical protein